jgi:hypothetical protein
MGQLVFEGPRGACPCCDKPTAVKIASTLGPPNVKAWVVPEGLLRRLYIDVAKHIRSEEIDGVLSYYAIDPSPYDASRRQKLYFVEGSEEGLAGPYGPTQLKVFLGTHDLGAEDQRVRIYVVLTTHSALHLIQSSSALEDYKPEALPTAPTGEDLF